MKQTKTLHNNLVGAFIVTTFIISSLYGILVYNAMEYTEDDILTQRVETEVQHYVNQYTADKKTARLPSSKGLYSYISSATDLPEWLKDQPPGTRELDEKELYVSVSELPNGDGRLYVVLDEIESSNLEQQLSTLVLALLSIGAVVTLIGSAIGVVVGRYISNPISQLTTEIEAFDYSEGPSARLSFHGVERSDEIGTLSRSFTRLVERLGEFLQREKQFTRYASHELRTPLTIVRNALAVLRLPSSEQDRQARNLDRIENATIEMEGLIETFMYLGREKQGLVTEAVHTDKVLQQSLDEHAYIDEDQRLQITTDIETNVIIYNEIRLVKVLFDNIIRNMFMHAGSRYINVTNYVHRLPSSTTHSRFCAYPVQNRTGKPETWTV